jgi:hypothetical protein
MFEYIHGIQGRVRVRTGILKANAALAQKFKIELSRIPGVRSAETNLLTGSVLIQHDGQNATTDAIATVLRPLAQASLHASLRNPSQTSLTRTAVRAASSHLLETMLERLLMTSLALL